MAGGVREPGNFQSGFSTLRFDVCTGEMLHLGDAQPYLFHGLAFCPDSKAMVSVHSDATIRLWDAELGRVVRQWTGHQRETRTCAVSPDGKLLATGGDDGRIMIWNPLTGRRVTAFSAHGGNRVWRLCFARDGKVLASSGNNGFVNLWETGSWTCLHRIPLAVSWNAFVALSPDGRLVAAAGLDNRLSIWESATGKLLHDLAGHKSKVVDALFAPDGKTLTSTSDDGSTLVWDLTRLPLPVPHAKPGLPLPPGALGRLGTPAFREDAAVWPAAFSPDGKMLAVASGTPEELKRTVSLWEVAGGKRLRQFHSEFSIRCLMFSHDGTILSGACGGQVICWDSATGQRLQLFNQSADFLAFSPTDSLLAAAADYSQGGTESAIGLWNVTTGKEVLRFPPSKEPIRMLAFSLDGTCLFSSNAPQLTREEPRGPTKVQRWDLKTGKQDGEWVCDSFPWTHSPDGKRLARWSFDVCQDGWLSPDGRTRAACLEDGIQLSDAKTGKRPHILPGVEPLSFSADGRYLATKDHASGGRIVRLWETATGKEWRPVPGHQSAVQALALSPDGRVAATGGADGLVQLWRTSNQQPLARFAGHTHKITRVAFSPDGRLVASGDASNTVFLWEASSGKEHSRFTLPAPKVETGGESGVTSLAFTPDGRRLLAGTAGGELRCWSLGSLQQVCFRKGDQQDPRSMPFSGWPTPGPVGATKKRNPETTRGDNPDPGNKDGQGTVSDRAGRG